MRCSVRVGVFLVGELAFACTPTASLPPRPVPSVAPSAPGGPSFFQTIDSDAWVNHTLVLQTRYRRVLLVDAGAAPPSTIRTTTLDLNDRSASPHLASGETPEPRAEAGDLTLRVDRVFATLQAAADAAEGGDLVAVSPGSYAGFSIGDKPSAGDGQFVHFRALGAPGEVVIDRPCPDDIQNNLIYGNFNHGIAQWNNQNPFDAESVALPPETPDEARDLEKLPLFGCHDNVIRNNTVLLANAGRAAVLLVNGSYGARLRNNILINDEPASMDVDRTSLFGLDAATSVANAVRYRSAPFDTPSSPPFPEALFGVAKSRFEEPRSTFGVTQEKARPEFMAPSDEPWIVVVGNWWKPNPSRPDFRPKPGSNLLAGRADPSDMPPKDLLGRPRTTADIGALAQAR